MSQPTPEEARKADHPETIDELKEALQKYRKLNSICKRFINQHHIQSREQIAQLAPMHSAAFELINDICECIHFDP